MPEESCVPRLGPGVKFRFDSVRKNWVLLSPERMFQPDEIAVAILTLVDGLRTIATITDILAEKYGAPRGTIAADVAALLETLAEKGVVRL